ncbi:MAG: hypothetical protein ACRELY_09275 [Polyangiaceae bacterium]
MRRHVSALLLALAIAACGGKLDSEENDRTVVFGTPAPSDAGSSSPNPTTNIASLPGLVLWLESTKDVMVDDGRVKNWLDQSPEHNNMALFDGQGATVGQEIGGMQTIQFDGASSYSLPFDTPLDDWSGDFLVEIVVRVHSPQSGLQAIFSCSGTPPNVPGFTRAVFYLDGDQTSECSVDSDGYSNESQSKTLGSDAALVGYWRHGNTLEAHRNALIDRSDDLPRATSPSCGKTIFGANLDEDPTTEDDYLASEIAEVVVVHGSLSDPQVHDVEHALTTKYAIP